MRSFKEGLESCLYRSFAQIQTQVQKYECNLEEIIEKLQASDSKFEIAEKEFLDKDDDVSKILDDRFFIACTITMYQDKMLLWQNQNGKKCKIKIKANSRSTPNVVAVS